MNLISKSSSETINCGTEKRWNKFSWLPKAEISSLKNSLYIGTIPELRTELVKISCILSFTDNASIRSKLLNKHSKSMSMGEPPLAIRFSR